MRSRFAHDCEDCRLVAVTELYDVYVCDRDETVVARCGPGPMYISAPDLRLGEIRVSLQSQRFYTSQRDVEDLLPGVRISRSDRP